MSYALCSVHCDLFYRLCCFDMLCYVLCTDMVWSMLLYVYSVEHRAQYTYCALCSTLLCGLCCFYIYTIVLCAALLCIVAVCSRSRSTALWLQHVIIVAAALLLQKEKKQTWTCPTGGDPSNCCRNHDMMRMMVMMMVMEVLLIHADAEIKKKPGWWNVENWFQLILN